MLGSLRCTHQEGLQGPQKHGVELVLGCQSGSHKGFNQMQRVRHEEARLEGYLQGWCSCRIHRMQS